MKTISSSLSSVMNNTKNTGKRPVAEGEIRIHPSIVQKMEEFSIKQKWKEVVGPILARAVTAMAVKYKVLYVSVNSAAIKNELVLHKSEIIKRINEELGKTKLTDMVVN